MAVPARARRLRRESLRQRITQFSTGFLPAPRTGSAIIPIIIGDESKALEMAAKLRERNIFIPAIRYPTVARGTARLRLTITASHTADDVSELLTALGDLIS